jgi:hypothetical protein
MKKRSLQSCTYKATLASAGMVAVNAGRKPNSVAVETRNSHGMLTDTDFFLMVVC